MLSLSFRQNLELRQSLCLELRLDSEYFQSFLVRTEKRLKDTNYQKGLMLLESDDANYRSTLDWLLATFSPSWKQHIQDFYTYDHCRLGDAVDFDTIDLIDQLMEAAVVDLKRSYNMLRRDGWLVGQGTPDPSPFMKSMTTMAVRSLISPRFPVAPAHPKAELSEVA